MRSEGLSARAAAPPRLKLAARSADERPLTRNESIVLKTLEASSRPTKAYELLDALSDEGLRAPMTIYRALSALIERGLVKKIASMNAFITARKSASAFVVCRQCGKTVECPLSREKVSELFAAGHMAIDDVFIEAYGTCGRKDCAAA